MTEIFSSFRQLLMGQYAAIAGLLVALFSVETQLDTQLVIGIVAIMIAFVTTRMGAIWFMQAMRIASYIVVAFELPELFEASGTKRNAWLMANRSEAGVRANIPWFTRFANSLFLGRYASGYDLKSFYVHQFVMVTVAVGIGVIYFYFGSPDHSFILFWRSVEFHEKVLFVTMMALVLLSLLQAFAGFLNVAKVREYQLKNWITFVKDRETFEAQYLGALAEQLNSSNQKKPAEQSS